MLTGSGADTALDLASQFDESDDELSLASAVAADADLATAEIVA
jgi:hypothetical protein